MGVFNILVNFLNSFVFHLFFTCVLGSYYCIIILIVAYQQVAFLNLILYGNLHHKCLS